MRANTGHLSPGSEVPCALPRQLSLTRRVSGVLLQNLPSPFCPCVPVEMGLSPYLGLLNRDRGSSQPGLFALVFLTQLSLRVSPLQSE